MKKVFLCICFCLLMFNFPVLGNFVFATTIPGQVKTLTKTPIYSEASVLADFVKDDENNAVYLQQNTILSVDTNFADTKFYKISLYQIVAGKTQEDYGYVLISQTLDINISSPTAKLDANATIKDDDTILYNLQEDNYTESGIVLKASTRIRILDGYDRNKEYTYISYQTDNGQIYYGHVKTKHISVDGVNYSVIVAISTLVVCVSLILIIFGIKGKKKEKKA